MKVSADDRKKKENVEVELEKYKNIDEYYRLYAELENEAKKGGSEQREAIRTVLREAQAYKKVKDDISDTKIKKDLKRIGQWKRQYSICSFEKDEENKKKYLELKKKKQDIEYEFSSIWNNLEKIMKKGERINNNNVSILQDLLSACVKLQANSIYYKSSENERNDYIRDLLKMAKYDVLDQARRGVSAAGKCAGELDILIEEDGLPITIIEALNLDCLDTQYLDGHLDKIYNYDTVGNMFNIVLSYVSVSDFSSFCKNYYKHIKEHRYRYPLISADDNFRVEGFSYSDIRVMRTVHKRNGCDIDLYHVCVLIR